MQGETPSLRRILEKYIEKCPLWQHFFFFSLSGTILYLSFRRGKGGVQGAGGREGCCFFFGAGLKCRGRNENQLAGRHYLSILAQECTDMERKNRPSSNPVKPALLFFFPASLSLLLFHSRLPTVSRTESETDLKTGG